MADRHTYILRLPPPLRESLAIEAAESKRSLNELIRQALCWRYAMDCPDITRGRKVFDASAAVENIALRVSEELFNEVRIEAQETGRSMRDVIIDVLSAHYKLKEVVS